MDKIWLVQRSRGSYDDYHDWVDSAWTTFEEAKKRAIELVHYDPQKELDKLPVLTVDEYGNNLTVADVLRDGTGFEGERWCDSPLSVGEFNRFDKVWLPTEKQKETCVQLVDHPQYFVEKEFLEKYNITVEDADKYIKWQDDNDIDEWNPDIVEIELSKPSASQLTYSYNDTADDFCAG